MSARDRLELLAYRLRPLEPVTLAIGVAVVVAVGLVTIPAVPAPPPEVLMPGEVAVPLTMVAVALALTVGFVCGRDVDVAEQLLASTPRPYRRALVLRALVWAMVLVALVALLAARGAGALEATAGPLRSQALVHLLFAGSLTLALSRTFGPLTGGGVALALIGVLAGGPLVFEGFPLTLLAEAESREWARTALRVELSGAALLAATYWRARP